MDYSAANIPLWNAIIQVGIISVMVIISNIIRLKIPFIKKALIPTSVLAGFILLGVKYLNILPIDTNFLDMVTYHGIAIGFIALSLRVPKKEESSGGAATAIKSGALIVSTYLVQALVGLGISLLLAYTFMPNLFKASGILLPMGYGQGPGQANNIGSTYEKLGFAGGKSYGLAIAAAGFICACIVGVIYINILARKTAKKRIEHEDVKGSVTIETFQDEGEMPISQSIDKLSIQMALILFVYILTYGIIHGVTSLLSAKLPGAANMLNPLLWGFNFIFGSIFAILVRTIILSLKKIKWMEHQYQNNYLLSRISGVAFDVMIISGIASINFDDISGLWVPFLLTCVLGCVATYFYLHFMCKKLYAEYPEEGFLGMFGMLTGTISSGILLVREIDPNFETPAANNLVSGSGVGIVFGAPVLIIVGMAPKSTAMTFTVLGIVALYLAILLLIIFLKKKNKTNTK